MKFFCEYCGNRIDAQVDHKCPNCGASYKKNNEFKRLQEEKNKETQQNKEFKQQFMNHTLSAMKFSKWFMFIPIIIFIVIFSIIIFGFISINRGFRDNSHKIESEANEIFDKVTEQFNESLEEEKEVIVNFNEYAVTSQYKVKVTKYELVEDIFDQTEEGYELVKFHLIVENTSGKQLTRERVNCIVDGVAQNNDFSSGYSDLPFFIQNGLAVKGTATFEVPKDATSYDIKYGDNVTIHIEK